MLHTKKEPAGRTRLTLLETVAWGGVVTSAALAGVGVAGIVGWATTLTQAGSAILIAGTLMTEIAASRMPVAAQDHWNAGSVGGRVKAVIVIGGFAVLTTWNVFAGHMGADAINRASVADKRAPIERALTLAEAELATAERLLADYDRETERRAEARQQTIMGADGRYVTARSRAQDQADEAADHREAGRAPLVGEITEAEANVAAARLDLRNAPNGRPDHELWAFALILELIKGALVWFAAPVRRRVQIAGNVLPIDAGFYAELEKAGDEGSLVEIESRAGAAKALAQHALRRLRKRAA